ncbi:MAG TPA: haloacid dehalogenase-like hydrolase [Puia sp.]|jgi:phosphoserine phosphatase|nr:haloacid dehalogenase-like hydrolase [Puia sp.]
MKLFISHSHDDKAIVDVLIELLSGGVGIPANSIFSSSDPGMGVPFGKHFNEYIVKMLQDEKDIVVIAMITNNYFNSNSCMFEYGVCAGLSRNIFPILGPRMQYANLGGFLSTVICAEIGNDSHILQLIQKIYQEFAIAQAPFDHLVRAKGKFITSIRNLAKAQQKIRFKAGNGTVAPHDYKYKVVAFDFDGTLLQSPDTAFGDTFHYSWKEVWKYLDYDDDLRRQLYHRHKNDPEGYPYQTWCDDCAEYFIRGNFKRSDVRAIIKERKLQLAEGLFTTLKTLKRRGMHLAIISGGIDTFYEEVVPEEIKRLFNRVFFNRFEYNSEGALLRIRAYQNRESDFRGKVDALREVCRAANATLEEAVFVGEGTNDIDVATSGCLSIAYPPSCTLDFKDIANVVTEDTNIATILGEVLVPRYTKQKGPNHYRRH